MKRICNSLLIILLWASASVTMAFATVHEVESNAAFRAAEISKVYGFTLEKPVKVDDLLKLSVSEISAKTGHSFTWKERLALKVAKFQLQKVEKKARLSHSVADATSVNTYPIGFILGLLLSLLGVLITYVVFPNDNRAVSGAWVGCLTLLLLVLLV
jgi:hypothetical protein